ncbi:hypothetical protein [Sphingobacterium siyangense]|uniref:hypothetical protein n=1 Tax=Sphingobacterium siyangense TaxID=459529 RepID=UPI002FDE0572
MSLLTLSTVATTSCSKSDSKQEILDKQGTKLIVKVSGIADEQSSITTKGSITATTKAPKIINYPEFDATVSVDNNLPASPIARITQGANFNLSSSISSSGAKAENMADLVKYRLFIFKQDGTFVDSESMAAGSTGSISLEPGNYKWAALSYNDETPVDDLTVGGSTDIVLPGGKDVLYANGDVTIADGNSSNISITFKRKYSRLGIELNTMGMFANMENANVVVSGLSVTKATIKMFDGGLKDFVSDPQTINYASFTNVDPSYSDAKIAYIYTANNAQSEVKVAVSNLTIRLDDGNPRNFTQTANFTFPITPVMGKSYRLLTNLIESPLTIERTATLSGTKYTTQWARQNVYYQAGHNPYRFHHTYKKSADRNSFFSFGSNNPLKAGKDGDPCANVYPAGVWKSPTAQDYYMLVGGGLVPNFSALSPTYNTDYTEYTSSTGTEGPYPSKNLRFYDNGQYINLGLVEDLINVQLGSTGRGHYWTGSAGIDLLGLLSLGAISYETASTGGLFNAPINRTILNIGDIQLLSALDVVKSNLKNVRCVRK